MPCTCSARKKELHYQPIPRSGSNYSINKPRHSLNSLNSEDPSPLIYCYVMTTIQNYDNALRHTGSGPNWQGGLITLCTCKHLMRTYSDCKQGTWIAGFSGVSACDEKNYLIYLMRVGQTFESHYDLWHALPPRVRLAKATDTNPLGDVYKPLGADTQKDPFNICRYHQPHPLHNRRYDMIKDINYRRNDNHRMAALLVGDVNYSFVWDQYKITFEGSIGRGQRRLNLGEFLGHIHEADYRQ